MKINLSRLLFATDFSDSSNEAIPYAVSLAREFQAELYFCHVIDLPAAATYGEALLDPQEIQQRIQQYAKDQLERLIPSEDKNWQLLLTIGRPAEEIARLSEEFKIDLVVAATHGRSGLERFVLGSVSERLMHILPCPLLIVRERDGASSPDGRFQKILVGCDFSEDSDLAVRYGCNLAQEFQSELHLVHVIEPELFKDLMRPDSDAAQHIEEDMRAHFGEKLDCLVSEEARYWCNPTTTLLAGQPHEEIIKYAVLHNIDLVVLGVHGRGFLEKLLLGSTTDRVVRTGPCPVLTVRPIRKPDAGEGDQETG